VRLVRVASLADIIVGITVLSGWLLGIEAVKSLASGASTMKANTSVLFVIGGVALWLAPGRRERRVVRALAGVMIAVAVATLVEYALGRDLGIDQLIARDLAPVPFTAAPGRMGINTAVAFVLAGAGLTLASATRGRLRRLAQWLGLTGGAIGVVSLTGYAYSVQGAYALTAYTQMAVHTAALHALLGIGIVFVNPSEGLAGVVTSPGPGGRFVRSVLPYVLGGPFLMGWLRLEGQQLGL
jgi:hypothetical protein